MWVPQFLGNVTKVSKNCISSCRRTPEVLSSRDSASFRHMQTVLASSSRHWDQQDGNRDRALLFADSTDLSVVNQNGGKCIKDRLSASMAIYMNGLDIHKSPKVSPGLLQLGRPHCHCHCPAPVWGLPPLRPPGSCQPPL